MGQVRLPTYTVKVRDPETGEERTEQRQSKTWQIRYYRAGKRHEESSGSTRKKDAIDLLRLREGDLARGLPVSAKAGRLKFDEAVNDVLVDYQTNHRKSSGHVERRIRLHLAPFFTGRRMASITTPDVRRYTAARQQAGAADASVNRELAILNRAFTLAKQSGLLHRPYVPMIVEKNTRKGYFERQEFLDVREAMPEPLKGVVGFAFYTGWRTGEILPLQWSQVDRAEEVVRLEPGTTKNDEGRSLPYGLLPELVEVIENAWQAHQELAANGVLCPHVFHRNGKPIKFFRKAWLAACEAAGVPGKLMHDFRRTAIRNLVRAGVGDTVAMGISGHRTRSIFDRYNITSETDLREGLGKLAGSTGQEKGKSARFGRVARFPQAS